MDETFNSVLSCFEQLDSGLKQLGKTIYQTPPKSWIHEYPGTTDQLNTCLSDIWYTETKDGRETRSYYGLVAANEEQLQMVQTVNLLKKELQDHIKQFRSLYPKQMAELKAGVGERHKALNLELQSEGLARLHIKQACRQIPILEQCPSKVGFNWYSSGRSIQKISKADAVKRLEKLGPDKPHLIPQWQNLASIKDNEPLALVQNLAPIMRANILFSSGIRKAMNVALPLFFPKDSTFPAFAAPTQEAPEQRTRSKRSDNRLEDYPFLPSIRVYRYR